jgi:hypothetical protein
MCKVRQVPYSADTNGILRSLWRWGDKTAKNVEVWREVNTSQHATDLSESTLSTLGIGTGFVLGSAPIDSSHWQSEIGFKLENNQTVDHVTLTERHEKIDWKNAKKKEKETIQKQQQTIQLTG